MQLKEYKRTVVNHLYKNWKLYLVGIVVLFVSMASINSHIKRAYSSDDVELQLVQSYQGDYGKLSASLGPDNFLLKYPLYTVIDATVGQSRLALLITNIILLCGTFTLSGIAFVMLLRFRGTKDKKVALRASLAVLMGALVVWLALLNDTLIQSLQNPNVRNIEIGIVLLAAVTLVLSTIRGQFSYIKAAVLTLAFSAVFYTDPYFTYTIGVAMALWLLYMWLRHGRAQAFAFPALILALSVILAKLYDKFFIAAGFTSYHTEISFIPIDKLGASIINTLASLLDIFNADFFGSSMDALPHMLTTGLNFMVLAIIVGIAIYTLVKKQHDEGVFFLIALAVLVTVFLLSTNSYLPTARYMVIAPFILLLSLPALTRTPSFANKRLLGLLVTLVAVSISINAYALLKDTRANIVASPNPNRANFALISQLESLSLKKGYSEYWSGNITTYLSQKSVMTLPIVCNSDKELLVYHWLLDEAWLNNQTDKSFIVFDKNQDVFEHCDSAALDAQFGPSQKVIVDSSRTLYIYNYDVLSRMPQRTNTLYP